MGEHKIPKDPIDGAIAGAERHEADAAKAAEAEAFRAEFPDHFKADFLFDSGQKMRIIVPNTFDADQFETAIGLLVQMRYLADQKREAAKTILTPTKPRLVRPDGGRLT